MVDGVEGLACDRITSTGASFSPNSKHVAYLFVGAEGAHLVVDGRKTAPFITSLMQTPIFTEDNQVFVIAAFGEEVMRISVDLP